MQTILLIEDDADLRENLTAMLEFEGYRVIEAEDGSAGVRLAAQHYPNLILCDFDLPIFDGLDVCTLLRQNRATRHIPIVILTGSIEKNERFQLIQKQVEACLFKPCSITQILAELERCLLTEKLSA